MVGIAIINYKTYQKTIECIDSIRDGLQIPYKIYLLDNGSENESAEVLRRTYENAADVRLIIEEKNHGYARGNNICIGEMRQDGCKIGIISNNDILCTPDSIKKLVEDLEENEKYYLRIWLVQLGMAGAANKESRKALLDGLKGHTAFRTKEEAEKFSIAQKEKRAAVKAAQMAEQESEAV